MKKRYYKNGDPELFNHFSDEELKDWTDREKAQWSPFSDVEQAPIPAEVVDFTKSQGDEDWKKDLEAEIKDLQAKLKEAQEANVQPAPEADQKKIVMEELRKKGIKFAPNSKLETLQKKLSDANNSE